MEEYEYEDDWDEEEEEDEGWGLSAEEIAKRLQQVNQEQDKRNAEKFCVPLRLKKKSYIQGDWRSAL